MENGFVLWEIIRRKVNKVQGIFQEDSLSPLLFAVALIPFTVILRTLKQEQEKEKRG